MLQYILEVTLCWSLFYLIFFGLLRKLTFFRVNRWYLLSSLLLGILIPLLRYVDLNIYQEELAQTVPLAIMVKEMPAQVAISVQEATIDWQAYIFIGLAVLYNLGLIFFIIRFCRAVAKIYLLKKDSRQEQHEHVILCYTDQEHLPFSFLNNVYISEKVPLIEDFQDVLQHELEHVRHWHTIDVLLVEMVQIAFWFNPLIYLYKTAIRQTHEYLADHAVLQTTTRKTYGTMLLKQSLSGLEIALTHRFFHSHIKKRINMMYQKKSGRSAWLKYALALPVLFLLAVVFANNEPIKEDNLELFISEKDNNDFLKELGHRLLNDKLINGPDQYTLTISKNLFRVNGVKHSSRIRNLYLTYFSQLNSNDYRFSDDDKAMVEMTPDFQSIELHINGNKNTYNNEGPLPDHMLETMMSQSQNQKFYFNNKEVLDKLNSELTSDRLIDDNERYDFLINKGQLIVNGQSVGSLQSKYENIIHELAQYPLDEDFELKIQVYSNESDFILGKVSPDIEEHSSALGKWAESMTKESEINHSDSSGVEEIFKVVDEMPRYPGCEDIDGDHAKKKDCADSKLIKYLYDNLKYPKLAIQNKTEGRVFLQFVVDTDGTIDNTRIVRDIGDGCGQAALDVVNAMNDMPKRWTPGRKRGQNVKVLYTLPVTFKIEGNTKTDKKAVNSDISGTAVKLINQTSQGQKLEPLIMLNGKIVQRATIDNLVPDDIASINVVKGKAAMTKYGEKGNNGVVEVTLKEGYSLSSAPMDTVVIYDPETFTETTVIKPRKDSKYKVARSIQSELDTLMIFDPETFEETTIITQDRNIDGTPEVKDFLSNLTKTKPLIIVDGIEYKGDIDKDITPDDIKKIVVVKGQKALEQYGKKGANGVVVIEMKNSSGRADFEDNIDQLQLPIDESLNPLYIINGKVASKAEVKRYQPDEIATINVIKGAAAKNKYGDKGLNGVVEITLKKKE